MPDPLVIGNWKMNGTRDSAARLAQDIVAGLELDSVNVVICPPTVFMADVAPCLKQQLNPGPGRSSKFSLGAQNICEFEQGAYTGEVSGHMLREFDCKYVIVGHSERRQLYRESDEQVADKMASVQQAGMQAVVCVGETLAEREQGHSGLVVARQLEAIVAKVGLEALADAAIAYEPIWAIGTGKVATPEMAQRVLSEVRAYLGALGEQTQLLYGGSVTAENAAQIFAQKDINGALVGGASLQAEQFIKICKLAGLN